MLSRVMTVDNLFRYWHKASANKWSSHVEEESTSNCDSHQALNDVPLKNIRDVAQNLRSDDDHGQLPSPPSPLQPSCTSDCECSREGKEEETNGLSQRGEFAVSARIQRPNRVESGAAPH